MSLVFSIDGTPIAQNVAPSAINITHRADGEQSFGGIPIEDPSAGLTTLGHRLFTVDETTCAAQPRLFTGFIMQRDIGRALDEGLFVGDDARLVDLSLADMNLALAFRQITGADGNRPVETWAARLTWILESDYLNEFISDDQTWIVTNTTSMEACDYRNAYANAVLDDLVDRSGGAYIYFAFYDTTAHEVRLFFDNDSESLGLSAISISNDWDDVDNDYVFAPDTVAKLAREPDQTYSDVIVTYDHGTKRVYRHRPTTAATYVRRGTEIQRPYTRGLATAESQAEKWLDKHSTETDRITCSIQVPANRVGLVEAGQSMTVRFTHLPGYETDTVMRVVSYSPKPTDDTGYWYDVALELVYRPAAGAVPCSAGSAEWLEDGPKVFDYSPRTTAITATPTFTSGIAIAALQLRFSYSDGIDYLGNVMTVASPWTMMGTDSDPLNLAYKTYLHGVAYAPFTGSAVPDITHSWSGVFVRPGEGFVMSMAIQTAATAPVQTAWAQSNISGTHIDLADPPTEGNILVLVNTRSVGLNAAFGWTSLHSAVCMPGADATEFWVRCVEADEGTVIPLDNSSNDGMFWYVSEWAVAEADTVIDLGPTPGATTEHVVPPTVDDDETLGYTVGSTWIDTATDKAYVLTDATDGAAVWVETTSGGTVYAPTTADYLVGTAQGGLSAEIVVGTTPGGELGGTWASPTVDATHSGSAHLALGSTGSTAAAGDHVHAGGGGSELLITDTPAGSPLVFADILQNDAGDALLYED